MYKPPKLKVIRVGLTHIVIGARSGMGMCKVTYVEK